MDQDNRESWLNRVAIGMAPLFEALGTPLPSRVRVAIGFTNRGAKGKAIGECWDNRCSGDGHFEIFIRPDLAHAIDAMPAQIAAILAHELVHAAVGIAAGHGTAFKRIAIGLGLVGPMRATTPGAPFLATVTPILAAAGPLPHARLDTGSATTRPKKQATRLLKCECEPCGPPGNGWRRSALRFVRPPAMARCGTTCWMIAKTTRSRETSLPRPHKPAYTSISLYS